MSDNLNQESDYAEFEAAYQKEFPVSASLMMDKFDRDEHGDYKENCVYTAYHLWQAARRASAPAPADVALPAKIKTWQDRYQTDDGQPSVGEAMQAEIADLRAALSRQSSAVGMEPVYQAFLGSEGWVDIGQHEIADYESCVFLTRTLYAAPALAGAPQAEETGPRAQRNFDYLNRAAKEAFDATSAQPVEQTQKEED